MTKNEKSNPNFRGKEYYDDLYKDCYTIKDIQSITNFSYNKIMKMCNNHEFRGAFKTKQTKSCVTGSWRIPKTSVEEYINHIERNFKKYITENEKSKKRKKNEIRQMTHQEFQEFLSKLNQVERNFKKYMKKKEKEEERNDT